MRVVVDLDAPDAGTATIDGRPYHSLKNPLGHVGSLLDAGAVQPSRSARNHLLWLAHSQGIKAGRVDEVIALAGLGSAARRKAGGYSLGMRQRLGIAAALLGDPPVLIFDEPFNGMDPEGIVWMKGFLRSLAAQGRAVLVSSHLMSELEALLTDRGAGHLVVVGRGKVIADTSVADLIAAASGNRITLRTTAPAEAMTVLTSAGAEVTGDGPGVLKVSNLSSEHAVVTLTSHAIPFSEITAHRATLEQAYLELTSQSVEYRAEAAPAGTEPDGGQASPGLQPWSKAGIIIKENTSQGSAYAAMMVTGSNGVRMQWDYVNDTPGLAGSVSASASRWLRLVRDGGTITGYDSADGTHWTLVGTAALPELTSAEYRRGLIRVSLTAAPRRGRLLAAKAVVIGVAGFVAGLVGAILALAVGTPLLLRAGPLQWPVSLLTEARMVVGTAALLAVAAVFALAIGTIVRRSGPAVAIVIMVIFVPRLLAFGPLAGQGGGQGGWELQVTPLAALSVQQAVPQFHQLITIYPLDNRYYPLAPWAGLAVECAWAAAALALAFFLLRRRDA